MNTFKKMKLRTKLRNCDYKLAGTVIKQQYYNDNSYTEINRMIDHFMEEPCFDRALDLIDYNEMIVFYFTESCTDGLYVRKSPIESPKSNTPEDTYSNGATPIYTKPPIIQVPNDDLPNKDKTAHTENLQKIQESEEWMDQMINRLARKPKLPTMPAAKPSTPAAPTVKIYNEAEVETFDTIEFKSPESFKDIEVYREVEIYREQETEVAPSVEIFYETEELHETMKDEMVTFHETEEYPEITKEAMVIFHETEEYQQEDAPAVQSHTIDEIHTVQETESTTAFEFVASADSRKDLAIPVPLEIIASFPILEQAKKKRPSFPNVIATLKIDLHTMMKQLDEYRYQLAYHPNNEQQMIGWIEALEKAVDEFSAAIDLIEDSYDI